MKAALLCLGLLFLGPLAAQDLRSVDDAAPALNCSTSSGLELSGTNLSAGPFSDDISVDSVDAIQPPARGNALRIGLWGDSHTAAGSFTEALASGIGVPPERMQTHFMAMTLGLTGVRMPVRKVCRNDLWQMDYAFRAGRAVAPFNRSLSRMSSEIPGAYLAIDFRHPSPAARVRLLNIEYARSRADRSLLLGISVDGRPEKVVSLTDKPGRVLQVRARQPMSTVRLRLIAGQITLEGLTPVYDASPALVFDVFSVPGSMVRGWLNTSPEATQDMAHGDYDLVMLQYGTNEGMDNGFKDAEYQHTLRASLRHFRQQFPHSACLLIGPPDRGSAVRGAAMPGVNASIARIQQATGQEFNCGFWDWQKAMGGPGAALRWLRSNPPLMQQDLVHLTPMGYQLSAQSLAKHPALRLHPVASR